VSAYLESSAPERPSLAKRCGMALLMLVMFPIAGVPFVAGIAAESAAIANVAGWEFRTVMIVQLVPVAVFAACGLVYAVVRAFLHPDDWR